MGAFLIGPLLVKYEWILIILSGILSYLVIAKALNGNDEYKKVFLNVLMNAVLIGLFTYKFSSILFQTENILSSPLAILYFSGGSKGTIFAAFLVLIYFVWEVKKYKYPFKSWIHGIVYGSVTFVLSYWLFRTLLIMLF
ncbi:hypothetical protein AF332_18610 [Sporosarcina globispora]|uniref:Uncharacterized protein n=1 Tax=Sporosarcina globispora TaxID=1459 RepID=A0A0M0GGJ9_SPOGL|nr:hypothetical protein [Sporosarcina globispora]KON88617.1 hypothetical protein AF332_18610 [Sporosarcina globispora]